MTYVTQQYVCGAVTVSVTLSLLEFPTRLPTVDYTDVQFEQYEVKVHGSEKHHSTAPKSNTYMSDSNAYRDMQSYTFVSTVLRCGFRQSLQYIYIYICVCVCVLLSALGRLNAIRWMLWTHFDIFLRYVYSDGM